MADRSKIEWTEATWNPITGCTLVSEGCRHCYAARLAATRLKHHPSRAGLARINAASEAKFTGEVRFNEQWLDQPLRWRRARMIFVCAHSDAFHESVPDEWLDKIFAVMALSPQHTFQVLTKRPEPMREYLRARAGNWMLRWPYAVPIGLRMSKYEATSRLGANGPEAAALYKARPVVFPLPNVWLGVSAEDQRAADARIPLLLATPAAKRFVSYEPALGPIDFNHVRESLEGESFIIFDALHKKDSLNKGDPAPGLDWVIAGGESGPNARPAHPDWFRQCRDQCAAAGVPFFFKQWGEWGPDEGPRTDGSDPIMEARARCGWWSGKEWRFEPNGYRVDLDASAGHGEWVYRLGKKRAGAILDGREHREFPA